MRTFLKYLVTIIAFNLLLYFYNPDMYVFMLDVTHPWWPLILLIVSTIFSRVFLMIGEIFYVYAFTFTVLLAFIIKDIKSQKTTKKHGKEKNSDRK